MDKPPVLDLKQIAANRLSARIEGLAVGARVLVEPPCDLCDALELLIPQVLRRKYPDWERESIDGFFFSSSVKVGEHSAAFSGTCILISDQRVTPFTLDFGLSPDGEFRQLRVRLGEPGGGILGISGPDCHSRFARGMLDDLDSRLGSVEWVYEASL